MTFRTSSASSAYPMPRTGSTTTRRTRSTSFSPTSWRADRWTRLNMTMRTERISVKAEIAPEVQFREIGGLRIRYADSVGSQKPVILLTSPWPESIYAFAPIWATLAEGPRLFAIELPGFGASERRDDLLSPQAMGGFLAQLIVEANLGRPHIVSPDVGTAAALFAAAAHPKRITSVIVGEGGAAVPLELGEPLASWVQDPDLDKYRQMDPRA